MTEHDHITNRSPGSQTSESGHDGMPQPVDPASSAEDEPTPQLTQSQVKRLATPMMGMVITMVVLAGLLAALWFMNPEPDVTYTRDENVAEAAGWADDVAEYSPIAPEVPDEWSANYARWENLAEFEVDVWEVGYTTESVSFVGFAQTDNANPAWVNAETQQAAETGSTTIDGLDFQIRETEDRRFLVLEAEDNDRDGTTVVIGGDAPEAEFNRAAEAIVDSIADQPTTNDDGEEPADD